MRRVSAVIGANYGDEGKGHIVDCLASPETMVVRFNGGAQAGHTVVTPDGRRHVFHTLGSGTFRGASTYLSRFFLVNPIVFLEEYMELHNMQLKPRCYVDPLAMVTTPYDMMLNRASEDKRSDARHGSCGMGVNETVERNNQFSNLFMSDLEDVDWLKGKLLDIRRYYVPTRMEDLGLDEKDLPLLKDDRILKNFLADCIAMRHVLTKEPWGRLIPGNFDLLFEGGQGLRLDEHAAGFPHVTRSRTGLPNVVTLLDEVGLRGSAVDAYYVTRPYITRHGVGPLSHELASPPTVPGRFEDRTNVQNPYQGALRFGSMDVEEMAGPILKDIREARLPKLRPHLAITCVDQMQDPGDGRRLANQVNEIVGLTSRIICRGPTRDDAYQSFYPNAKEDRTGEGAPSTNCCTASSNVDVFHGEW
jgi:adenylosuccinate synthase